MQRVRDLDADQSRHAVEDSGRSEMSTMPTDETDRPPCTPATMADRVQEMMERMVPALENLQASGIFSAVRPGCCVRLRLLAG